MTTPKDTWISVKDAMPIAGSTVLCTQGGDGLPFMAKFIKSDNPHFEVYPYHFYGVTHWMDVSKPKTK